MSKWQEAGGAFLSENDGWPVKINDNRKTGPWHVMNASIPHTFIYDKEYPS